MGERPKIAVVDDPLAAGAGASPAPPLAEPRRRPSAKTPRAAANGRTPTRAGARSAATSERSAPPDLASEALTGVFGRVPASLARRLEGMVFQLRAERKVSQQDILAALLFRFVDHADERSVAEMHRLLDGYEKTRDPRRSRQTHSA